MADGVHHLTLIVEAQPEVIVAALRSPSAAGGRWTETSVIPPTYSRAHGHCGWRLVLRRVPVGRETAVTISHEAPEPMPVAQYCRWLSAILGGLAARDLPGGDQRIFTTASGRELT